MKNSSLFANLGLEDLEESLPVDPMELAGDITDMDAIHTEIDATAGALTTLDNTNNAIAHIANNLTETNSDTIAIGLESICIASGVSYNSGEAITKESLESIGSAIGGLVDKAISKLVDLIFTLFKTLFGAISKLKRTVSWQMKTLGSLSGSEPSSATITVAPARFVRNNKGAIDGSDLLKGMKFTETVVSDSLNSDILKATTAFANKLRNPTESGLIKALYAYFDAVIDYGDHWHGKSVTHTAHGVSELTSKESMFGNAYASGVRLEGTPKLGTGLGSVKYIQKMDFSIDTVAAPKGLSTKINTPTPREAKDIGALCISVLDKLAKSKDDENELTLYIAATDGDSIKLDVSEEVQFGLTLSMRAVTYLLVKITNLRVKLIKKIFSDITYMSEVLDKTIAAYK